MNRTRTHRSADEGIPERGHGSGVLFGVARWWARREIRRTLDGLRVAGLQRTGAVVSAGPTIFAANHVSFWDVFLLLALDQALGTEGYAVMDEENVCRVPLFRQLGAIPIRRGYPRAGIAAAATRLQRAAQAVWIFPQGENRPAHLRPLGFKPGVQLLSRLTPRAVIVPVGIQYAFAAGQGPVCYASFGDCLSSDTVAAEGGLQCLESAVERELDRIDRCLGGAPDGFESLVESSDPTRKTMRGAWIRLLNAITAGRRPSVPAKRSPDTPAP